MAELLAALTEWPDIDTASLQGLPEWRQARAWGWVMDSGELTGTGAGHAHRIPDGLVFTDSV